MTSKVWEPGARGHLPAFVEPPPDPEEIDEDILQDMVDTWAADLAERSRREAAEAVLPSEAVLSGLERAGAGLRRAEIGLEQLPRVGSADVAAAVSAAGALGRRLEAALYALAQEAGDRGLHRDQGFSLADWLSGRIDWPDTALISTIGRVAEACTYEPIRPVGTDLAAGRYPARRASIVVTALGKVRRVLSPESFEAYVEILREAAADPALDDAALARAARHLLDVVLEEAERDRDERAAEEQRSLRSYRLAGGMTRFVIDAPERQAAVLRGVLTSKLTDPVTGPDGERDPRSVGARQLDALMTVVSRGVSCPDGVPQMPRATLFITMKLDDLAGRTRGHGTTLTGHTLSAKQVRQAACEAEIIPVVLGSSSQPLDYGRAVRLATREQVKALYHRDRGCTFPGCTIPAPWTIAHHHPWFSRGGATDLDKLALLCEAHHTYVHQHDLECTIDAAGVTWHLR